ncbi:alpha/beta hydrolase [Schaalia sp. 19OD2882]|uniref:alpha/beta fold hydrolase n=1 Tax=Schaalia sp. 19OD2882 TaxID=2794089 RepID=UPI001C1EC272|nr:alpha/beta hydrolase [Schaalia sp. 19OD2882]QWW18862.1 alpha/beta hydrolase [Schaalia sp. 19OD2882]
MDTMTTATGMMVHCGGTEGAATLVLAHGLTDSGRCWPDAVAHWGAAWWILCPDMRSHGDSPRLTADQRAHTDRVWTEDLLGLLESLPEPPVLVGHSQGGRIGTLAALARPDLVRALVLEDPALSSDSARPANFNQEHIEKLTGFAERLDGEKARMKRQTPWSDTEIEAWALAKAKMDVGLFEGFHLESLIPSDPLGRLQVPTLVLYDRDGFFAGDPRPQANPLVTRVDVDGVGHCIRRDAPQVYHDLVDPWIDAHR